MRVGLLTTEGSFSGNTCLAFRIKEYVEEIVDECVILSHCDTSLMERLGDYCEKQNITFLIGVHVYRSGTWLKDGTIPYCLVLGGTDATIFLRGEDVDGSTFGTMREALNNSLHVVAFAEWMVKAITQKLGEITCPISYIPQSVGNIPDAFPDVPSHIKDIMKKKCFCLVAGIRPVKDILFLVNAMDLWHEEDNEVQMLVLGDTRNKEYAKNVEKRLKISASTQMVQPLPQGELFPMMKRCVACLNTSVDEGMCGTLLEAMAIGVPVIARRNKGNAHIVSHNETGLLFDNADECVALAKKLISDQELKDRIVASAIEYINRHHSRNIEKQSYVECMKKAVLQLQKEGDSK
eukprot:m.21408 g.21408  ORF g.21408 m.21408 type:complete len:350 (+) comp5348_c0_seq1:102-1151(+)